MQLTALGLSISTQLRSNLASSSFFLSLHFLIAPSYNSLKKNQTSLHILISKGVPITDLLINLISSSSSSMPGLAQHQGHDDHAPSSESPGQGVTPEASGKSNTTSKESFVTAPEGSPDKEADKPSSNDPDEAAETHKKRAACLQSFQEIQDVLIEQHHQLQVILFSGVGGRLPFLTYTSWLTLAPA